MIFFSIIEYCNSMKKKQSYLKIYLMPLNIIILLIQLEVVKLFYFHHQVYDYSILYLNISNILKFYS